MYAVSIAKGETDDKNNERSKEEPDLKDLSKEIYDKVTEESNETKTENHAPDETESVKNKVNDTAENKNDVDKPGKEDFVETKIDGKSFDEEENKKVSMLVTFNNHSDCKLVMM